MTLLRCLAACCGLVVALHAGAAPASRDPARLEAESGGVSAYRLNNGFKIVLAPYPAAASVRVELLVKTGSKLEGYGETGMAHLLEHMLFKSAGSHSDLKSALTRLGATWNGTTTADRTNFFETVDADPAKVDALLRLEADRFIRASFTRQHLASEMTVVRNELERNDSNPGSLVLRALQRESFFWHGYGRPTIGARSDIEDAPFAALQAFHRRHYRPDNAVLIVSGNFSAPRVLALASQLFAVARNPETPAPASWTREEPQPATGRSDLYLPAGKTVAASSWRLPGLRERRLHAFDLGVTAICDDDWGSLRKDLVIERKLAVRVSCGVMAQPDYSLLVASADAGPEADGAALAGALQGHVEQAAARGVDAAQLERARQAELNAYTRLLSSHEALAEQLSEAEVAGDWRLFFWQRDVVADLKLDEVNAALRQWTVAVNRNDVLLHHATGVKAPELPTAPAAAKLLAGRHWPAPGQGADPLPTAPEQLARATRQVALPGSPLPGLLISRHTQGDLAWLTLANDYGSLATLSGRQAACGLASQLLAYGGGGLDRDQLSARLEALQARWTLGLGGLTLEAPRAKLQPALDLLLAAWQSPLLPEAEFDRLKAAAIARLQAAAQDPAQLAANQSALRFDNYPAGHPLQPRSLASQEADFRAVAYADARACLNDFAGRSRLRLALVGDFNEHDLGEIWQRIAQLPAAGQPYARVADPAAPAAVDTAPIRVALPAKPNAMISGSALLPISDGDPDFPALRVAVKILGGDAESRVFKRLREQDGLAYGAGALLSGNSFEPRSRFVLQASAATPQADAALAALQQELTRALRDGFTEQEVARARQAWLEERKTSLGDESAISGMLAASLLNGRDYAWLAAYDAKIAKLGAAEVNAALRRYLGTAPIVWAVGRGE